MHTRLLPDDHEVTLAWTTTATDAYERTFTLGELREAINTERRRLGEAQHPDIGEDLHLLTDSFLADHEDGGSLVEFTREITDTPDISLPTLPEFTVTVAGPERHDGEAPYTYCLHAADEPTARALALEHHIAEQELGVDWATGQQRDPDAVIIDGPWDTFPSAPSWPQDLPGRAWSDLRTDTDLLARAYRTAAQR